MNARNGISDEHVTELHIADYDPAFVDPGHGHSRAAWASVIVMIAAFTFGTLFFFLDMPTLVWASAGVDSAIDSRRSADRLSRRRAASSSAPAVSASSTV